MQIKHRFQELSKEDSGKEHVFTWTGEGGRFLFHAMYQSGGDEIPTSDGGVAQRGTVLRLQTQENGLTLAPSNDKAEGCLALKVYDERWTPKDYERLAGDIADKFGDKDERTAAAYAQLASLYNLMATQYGKLFDNTLACGDRDGLDRLITDPKLKALSSGFEELARERMHGETAHLQLGNFGAAAPEGRPLPFDLKFRHDIVAEGGNKNHLFECRTDSLPWDQPLLKAKYQSGSWGETIMLTLPLPLADGKEVTIPANVRAFNEQSQPEPVTADEQYKRMKFYEQAYFLAPEQVSAALVMLASVYRLAASHYQGAYAPKAVSDDTLREYVRNERYSREADKLLTLAGVELGIVPDQNRAVQEAKRSIYLYESVGNAVSEVKAGRQPASYASEASDHVLRSRAKDIQTMAQPTIDHTFMDQRDFERAWDSYRAGKIGCFVGKHPSFVVQRTSSFTMKEEVQR